MQASNGIRASRSKALLILACGPGGRRSWIGRLGMRDTRESRESDRESGGSAVRRIINRMNSIE